jgi:methylenetetrahydrofolate--tRNA-(uracil-5-)-methyltransferase
MVPGLQNAEFVRMGVIHRNTYIDSPRTLTPWLEFKTRPNLFLAGQITGVEGYVESAAMGIYVAHTLIRRSQSLVPVLPPRACAFGSLISHLTDAETDREFAPMNINWGLFPDPEPFIKNKGERKLAKIAAAQSAFSEWHVGLYPTN